MALVHGLASSFEHNWRRTGWVDLLADMGRPVIPVDLLGHGTAPAPTDPAAYERVDELVLAALPGDTPVDAVGFSAGARILLRLAGAHPGRFARLALLGAGDNVLEPDDGEGRALADAFDAPGDTDDVRVALFLRLARSAGNDPSALAAFLRRPQPPLDPADLARISGPVLVVLGDEDHVAPGAHRLLEALPQGQLVTLRGVDHFATPGDFGAVEAVLRFLERA